jgi:hypothetical protein
LKQLKSLLTILFAAFNSTPVPELIYGAPQMVSSSVGAVNEMFNQVDRNFDGTFNAMVSHAYAAGKENNETYTFREICKQEDRLEFVNAIQKEIDDHTLCEHWEVIPCSMMPDNMKTIMSVWSFKRKRFPDGTLNNSIKLAFVLMVACSSGLLITGILTHLMS